MQAILSVERRRLGALTEQLGQLAVMAQLPQFSAVQIHNTVPAPERAPEKLKMAVFNMERGVNLEQTIEFLEYCPALQQVDLILGNELDDGNVRSGQRNVAREIAENLGFNYVFGLEFMELANPLDEKGYHGNAIFSRWPILWAESFYPDPAYNWYHSEQPRVGSRVAILAEINVAGQKIGVVTAHLENRTDPAGRRRQMQQILEKAEKRYAPEQPVVLGGDFNTYTYFDDTEGTAAYLQARKAGEKMPDLLTGEPLLKDLEQAGFNLADCNDFEIPTCRDYYKPTGEALEPKIDWIMTRNMKPVNRGVVSTLSKACRWAPPDGALRHFEKTELSDHDAVWIQTLVPGLQES